MDPISFKERVVHTNLDIDISNYLNVEIVIEKLNGLINRKTEELSSIIDKSDFLEIQAIPELENEIKSIKVKKERKLRLLDYLSVKISSKIDDDLSI